MNQLLKLGTKQALKDSGTIDIPWLDKLFGYLLYVLIFGIPTFFIGLGVFNLVIELRKYLDEIKSSKKKTKARSLKKVKTTYVEKHEFMGVGLILGFLFPYYFWAISGQSLIAFCIIGLCFIFVITFGVIALIGESKKPKPDDRNFEGPVWTIVGTFLVAALLGFGYRLRTF